MIFSVSEENNEPVIKLAGSQLRVSGFNVDDIIKVSIEENQIRIYKNKETTLLQSMERRNPSLKKLMKEFNLDLL